ncbi:MAG: reverse transcriptase domain-containing protein [Leptolyngbya sp. BL-A-14]
MPLTLTDSSLNWALKHALTSGDTDIFPDIFEFHAIEDNWNKIKASIQEADILAWKVRPFRRRLVPKHRFGFRISTQLDPLDFLVFTALIKEIGEKLESERISTIENIVHSYRFSPNSDGRMFSDQYTYRSFQKASHDACEKYDSSYVVIADIADFFPRLYTHRIDNAMDSALGVGHMHAKALKNLIAHWAGSYSYGIPVGSAASRLIAEVTISDIDQILLSEDAKYVRYSDDFRIFCDSEAEAYKYLTLIARSLLDNHGLTLQQNKTKIVSVDVFRRIYLKENEKRELETLSERFYAFMIYSLRWILRTLTRKLIMMLYRLNTRRQSTS